MDGSVDGPPLALVTNALTKLSRERLLQLRAAARGDPRAIRRLTLRTQGVEEPGASYLEVVP